jgi:hypothetical protein
MFQVDTPTVLIKGNAIGIEVRKSLYPSYDGTTRRGYLLDINLQFSLLFRF